MATSEKSVDKRNKYFFSLGTIGRDMLYTLISMYLMFYMTDILNVSNWTLGWLTVIMMVMRIWDAVNDPVMGVLVDNTRSRWGKFKPWIAGGALISAIFTVLFFTNYGSDGTPFIILFTLIYVFWEISFTANDIAYWSMMPTLTIDQKERERIGAMARICANIGLALVVVGITPITKALGGLTGSMQTGYLAFAIIIAVIMVGGQCFTLIGVKEHKGLFIQQEKTTLRDLGRAIFKNDQLLVLAVSMTLFMVGYSITTSFGQYYFKYAYGNEDMYSIFGGVLILSQIGALFVFPLFSKRFARKILYAAATVLVVLGYLVFFFAPADMIFISIAGMLIFIGQAFIQLLMLVFLADSIEYGQWKLGKRNESVTFSIQPFINKIGSAAASGVVGVTVIISGINAAATPADVTPEGLLIMKTAMLLLPLICIVVGYIVYRFMFKIDKKFFDQIVTDLKNRGEIQNEE